MSSALDKSLDEIISTNRKVNKSKVKAKVAKVGKKPVGKPKSAGVSKKTASTKKPVVVFKKPAAPAAPAIDLTAATKVVVHGLPKDIKIDAIKEFFQSQVGGVQNVALTYNERGQFKGIATIIFKSSKFSTLAVSKYNGAPIDGGSSKLRLELIIDPTKKSLSSRISPVAQQVVQAKAAQNKKAGKAKKPIVAGKANAATKPKAKPNGAKKVKKPTEKKAKKTVEQLDQEMADYFKSS